MNKNFKQMIAVLIISALVLIPFGSAAMAQGHMNNDEQLSGEKMVADALLVRPVGVVATIAGAAVFIVSLPFSALGGNTKTAWKNLVVKPATFTFKRPLGDL
ncbi:MAG: hypothetical protein PHP23_09110 [Desulfobacterales bacterium]|nr:hypothetical protein [Desulfobacterales bacterium]MDD4072405.1 hypothetical protein [Desulfobacterales bacterium]MDD4393293.1 hypothetical protein [Desulfobacterales bacterium]